MKLSKLILTESVIKITVKSSNINFIATPGKSKDGTIIFIPKSNLDLDFIDTIGREVVYTALLKYIQSKLGSFVEEDTSNRHVAGFVAKINIDKLINKLK